RRRLIVCVVEIEAWPRGDCGTNLKCFSCCICTSVRRLVERVTRVASNSFECDGSAGGFGSRHELIKLDHEVLIIDGLTVGFLPSFALPPGHPLGNGIDGVLGVREDAGVVCCVLGGFEEFDNTGELSAVVGGVVPSTCGPVGIGDVPGPACRSWVAECGAVYSNCEHACSSKCGDGSFLV